MLFQSISSSPFAVEAQFLLTEFIRIHLSPTRRFFFLSASVKFSMHHLSSLYDFSPVADTDPVLSVQARLALLWG